MPLYQPPDVNAHVLSQFSLAGKVVAVTGGARGIGVEAVRGVASNRGASHRRPQIGRTAVLCNVDRERHVLAT